MKLSKIFNNSSPEEVSGFNAAVSAYLDYTNLLSKRGIHEFLHQYSDTFKIPTLVGIEVEVEKITKEIALPVKLWQVKDDLSLRNHGKEYTTPPMNPEQAFTALLLLWEVLYKASGEIKPDFSWRTSIQFHINAMELEEEEFCKFLLLTLVFEQVLFSLIGEERENSNFCVPLCRSHLMAPLGEYLRGEIPLVKLHEIWDGPGGGSGQYKYSATNLARLGGENGIGTVEFRHLGGSNDLKLVCLWLSIILHLYKAAITMNFKKIIQRITDLNSLKNYDDFAKEVFGATIAKALKIPKFSEQMKYSVTKVKELLIPIPEKYKGGCKPDSAIMEYALTVQKRQLARKEVAKKTKK
jgi:hypothetical protein